MRDDNCIFCKILNGDIPSRVVFEDADFQVIMDAEPATKGHCLILPKDHSHTAKIARIILASHPVHRHGALYGAAFPFRAKQSNVFILPVCSFQGASKGRKKPLTDKPKNEGVCPAFSENF